MRDKYQGPIAFTRGRAPVVMPREWRVTRPGQYLSPTCPGHKDKSARQGYFVDALNAAQAQEVARVQYGLGSDERLDVEEWA